MECHYRAKFGGHRQCSIGDKMFSVVEGQDTTCPRFNPRLQFISKAHGMPCEHTHKISGRRHNN